MFRLLIGISLLCSHHWCQLAAVKKTRVQADNLGFSASGHQVYCLLKTQKRFKLNWFNVAITTGRFGFRSLSTFLKRGENANIWILKSFAWARVCCVHISSIGSVLYIVYHWLDQSIQHITVDVYFLGFIEFGFKLFCKVGVLTQLSSLYPVHLFIIVVFIYK